ncbi:MAG: SDR family oxidoreductase [Primorskyibacter sp.]
MAQRVLITAGGAGIGAGLVAGFAASGARVVFCDVDPAAVAQTEAQVPGCRGWVADVTDETAMNTFLQAAEDHLGGVDTVCANAGIGGPAARIEDIALADWRATLDVNLTGAFLTCRWAARLMRAQGHGAIFLTSSTAGQWGFPHRSPYATAKWGVIGLMKTLASELGPAGVRVNALCPGSVEGPRIDRVIDATAQARGIEPDEVRADFTACSAMNTFVSTEDIAHMALFLASPAGARISGQAIAIDGHTLTCT